MTKKKKPKCVPVGAYEYAVVQLVTIAKFRRPREVRQCDPKRYHAWIWRSSEKLDLDTLREHVPIGLRCQCRLLTS